MPFFYYNFIFHEDIPIFLHSLYKEKKILSIYSKINAFNIETKAEKKQN